MVTLTIHMPSNTSKDTKDAISSKCLKVLPRFVLSGIKREKLLVATSMTLPEYNNTPEIKLFFDQLDESFHNNWKIKLLRGLCALLVLQVFQKTIKYGFTYRTRFCNNVKAT